MKKLLLMLLTACVSMLCMAACSIPGRSSSVEDLSSDSLADSTSSIEDSSSDFPSYSIDNEENCSDSEHVHTSKCLAFETCHQFVYTCGCPYPDIAEMHMDEDHDGACDICGYSPNNRPSTTNCFLRDQVGARWLQSLQVEDIAEVKLIIEYIGVAPGTLKDIQVSDDMAAIAEILTAYSSMGVTSIPDEDAQIDGGGAVTIQFTLTSGLVKELYINNGIYCDLEGNYFELHSVPVLGQTENYDSYYGFVGYNKAGTVWTNDANPERICEIDIDDLEFDFMDDLVDYSLPYYSYKVETEFGTLVFFSPTFFYNYTAKDHVTYKLVGKTLDELMAEALSPNYSVTINDEFWLWEELQPTYKAGETVSVKIAMALDVGYLFLVNGKQIAICNDVDGMYWEFTFTMPAYDVVIDFKTFDGFLPDYNYGVLIETYWLQNLDAESVSVYRYYGEFDSGAIVAIMHAGSADDVVWSEVVNGLTFQYYNSDRITVLYDGVFYTLPEAYDNGYITADDLSVIAELHNE